MREYCLRQGLDVPGSWQTPERLLVWRVQSVGFLLENHVIPAFNGYYRGISQVVLEPVGSAAAAAPAAVAVPASDDPQEMMNFAKNTIVVATLENEGGSCTYERLFAVAEEYHCDVLAAAVVSLKRAKKITYDGAMLLMPGDKDVVISLGSAPSPAAAKVAQEKAEAAAREKAAQEKAAAAAREKADREKAEAAAAAEQARRDAAAAAEATLDGQQVRSRQQQQK